jgi:HAE1 family hydrophobic/amphiphilic exporter-1
MGLVGVAVAFWLTHSTFDSSGQIGLILLFGVVVNNAILLVSRYRTEASLILRARLPGDASRRASLFPGLRKQLGCTDLWMLDKDERYTALRRAVARATRIRLRSILLTSGTTIAGLAPLVIHTSDNDIWENLALASIGGLAASTVLLIVAFPPIYYYCVRLRWVWWRLYGWLRVKVFRRSPPPARLAEPQSS